MLQKLIRILRLADARSRQGGLPLWRQLAEMLYLWSVRQTGPSYYMLGKFWRRGMSFRDKLAYLNEAQYQRAINRLNPEPYRKLSQHKVAEKALLTLLGFRTPRFLGYYHPLRGRTHDGRPLRCADDLSALLSDCGEAKVCFKVVEGWGGNEFKALELHASPNGLQVVDIEDGQMMGVEQFAQGLRSADGYLLEAYLKQHSAIAALNPSSLNTLRVWVSLGKDGGRVGGAFLRVGRTGSTVDNTSRGGLACPVDLETGKLSSAEVVGIERVSLQAHPDSNVAVTGLQLPHWEACKQLAIDALAAFPHMHFAGLDIAIGEDGPWIIELNIYPDKAGATIFDVPTVQAMAPPEPASLSLGRNARSPSTAPLAH